MGKKGRPKKEEKRGNILSLRLSNEEVHMLEYLETFADLKPSEALRMGLRIKYNLEKSKHQFE